MAKKTPVIPTTIDGFNKYLIVVFIYIKTNMVRLMVSSADFATLTEMINDPATGWTYLYTMHSDVATQTKPINAKLKKSKLTISQFLRYLYRNFPRNVMIVEDYQTFNIAELNSHHSRRAKITTTPYGNISSKSGGVVDFAVRDNTEVQNAAMEPLADAIRVYGVILNPGDALPTNVSQCNLSIISKKAKFSYQCPTEEAGNRFACYLQYVNLSDDSKSGPLSGLMICIIAL